MTLKPYQKKAIKKYQSKKDNINISLPLGTKEKIRTLTGETVNGFINRLVKNELEKIEKTTDQDGNFLLSENEILTPATFSDTDDRPENIFINYKG